MKPCPLGCLCRKHQNRVLPCKPDCKCGRHRTAGPKGTKPCLPGCRCGRHESILRNRQRQQARKHFEEAQQNKCKICGLPAAENGRWGKLNLDHDHKTGALRGLLCNDCNIGLGMFKDNPELLARALDHLVSGGFWPCSEEFWAVEVSDPGVGQ